MESKFQEDWCCWCLDPKTEASHKHKLLPSAGRTVVVTQRFSLMKFASAVEDVLPGWECTSSLSHGTPPPFLGGLQIAKDRRWIPCAYTHSLNHSTAHPGAANGIKTQETNNLNHFVIGFVFFFYYQGKFSVVHALHYFPSCISGGVTPATQVKAQWPIRRHHRVSWRVNVTWTRTVKKKQKSNMDRPLLSDRNWIQSTDIPITWRYWRTTLWGSGPRKTYRSRIPPRATQVSAGVGCSVTSKETFKSRQFRSDCKTKIILTHHSRFYNV